MINESESHMLQQESVISLTWMTYILEDWTSVEYYYLYYIVFFLWMLPIILFVPLLIFIIFSCFLKLLLFIYKRKNSLREDFSSKAWDNARFLVASLFSVTGKLWHGYELHGMEKIPEGPGLIVYYHGPVPIDYCYFIYNLYIQKRRVCYSVVDHFIAMLPGVEIYLNLLPALHSGREECVEILKKGNLLGVAPGGAREAFCSDENYNFLWGNRTGFAQVAIDAKVLCWINEEERRRPRLMHKINVSWKYEMWFREHHYSFLLLLQICPFWSG
ncbi:DGAT1/2-independent enzyme synthesizing storage lipids isoform X2 [Pelodiscus sinensis]|uniref:DGAT1/2-independent enzyme synthesizing storage lipids isoform X2 n=1 Tax=Pelodiscus sinensis TaxID=13735 RepID=UPI003F6D50F1